jgi:hypothetical protein
MPKGKFSLQQVAVRVHDLSDLQIIQSAQVCVDLLCHLLAQSLEYLMPRFNPCVRRVTE